MKTYKKGFDDSETLSHHYTQPTENAEQFFSQSSTSTKQRTHVRSVDNQEKNKKVPPTVPPRTVSLPQSLRLSSSSNSKAESANSGTANKLSTTAWSSAVGQINAAVKVIGFQILLLPIFMHFQSQCYAKHFYFILTPVTHL